MVDNLMDWNWFFSSLAQSTAAIVGIFGAFVFAKIISNEAEYNRKLSKLRELKNRAARLVDEAHNRYFHWYNQQVEEEEVDHLIERFDEPTALLTPEEYLDELNFSPYVPVEETLALIREKVDEENQIRLNPSPSTYIDPLMRLPVDPSSIHIRSLRRAKIEEERVAIKQLRVEVDDHIRFTKGFFEEVRRNPESSDMISKSILASILLFFVGVIYPLSFMPIPTGSQPSPSVSFDAILASFFSLRGILLLSVSVIFSGVMLAFFILNKNLSYPSSDLMELERLMSMETYSSYFANEDRNRDWWSSRSKDNSHVV
jgi:hypothetical protein